MTCPICGGPLVATASHAQTAPWLCTECHFAWWEAELTEEAHMAFRRSVRDFNYHPGVRDDSIIERERALVRSKGSA